MNAARGWGKRRSPLHFLRFAAECPCPATMRDRRTAGDVPAFCCHPDTHRGILLTMPVSTTSIAGLLVVRSPDHRDDRGFFRQTYQVREIAESLHRDVRLVQGNHSRSHARVLRGFHLEAWDKCVYVARGTATCVIADVRPGSVTFGQTASFALGDPPGERVRLFIAEGLCNAVYCHTEVDYLNEVSHEFDPSLRGGIIWNDPDLDVRWPDADPILSAADAALPTLRSFRTSRGDFH